MKVFPMFVVACLVKYCVRRIVEASGGAITEAEAKKSIEGVLLDAMDAWRKLEKRNLQKSKVSDSCPIH